MNKLRHVIYFDDVNFSSILSDFEFIKTIYRDNLKIVEESNDDQRLIFSLSLQHEIEIGNNIKEIVTDLKIDNFFKLDNNKLGLPYTVSFEIFSHENMIIIEIDLLIHWLRKVNNAFLELDAEIQKLDSETFIFNFLETLKTYIKNPEKGTLLSWFQDVKENNILKSTSQVNFYEDEEKESSDTNDSLKKLKARVDNLVISKKISQTQKNINIQNVVQKEMKETDQYDKFLNFGGVVGETFTDRASTFQSHAIKISCIEMMNKYLSLLKSNNKIQKATHNIIAYRFLDEKRKIEKGRFKNLEDAITEGFDDDGEEGAGDRLLGILRKMKVYNILVVVSRWFGGTLLGNDRYKHINDSAKKIILFNKNNFDWIN